MKEMYKDNAGNWHYGCKGEKLTEVSYSTNSVPDSIPVDWVLDWLYLNQAVYKTREDVTRMLNDWWKENGRSE